MSVCSNPQKHSVFHKRPFRKVGMDDICGLLKVTIIRGRNLVKRDLFSSDPYVKLKLGDQVVKTHVIRKSLNPEWNEDLTLFIPNPPEPLKLFVYDHDTFSFDDEMGDLELDLHPLVTSAKLENVGIKPQEGSAVNLQKVVASDVNNLIEDSCIKRGRGGHVVQDIHAKLRNVEKGEIELELTWIPPPPC